MENSKLKRMKYILEALQIFIRALLYSVAHKRKLIYFGSATYGNVGDLAISVASKKFLDDNVSTPKIFVNDSVSVRMAKILKPFIRGDDFVLFQGGGNMGTLYTSIEQEREAVFTSLRDTGAIFVQMPTSANFYSVQDKNLSRLRMVYKNVRIFTRESYSQDNVEKLSLGKGSTMVPDIVFSLLGSSFSKHGASRHTKRVLVIKRDDQEKASNRAFHDILQEFTSDPDISVTYTDTIVNVEPLSVRTEAAREKIVASKIDEIQNSDLVLTDRLHGMILSLIAGVRVVAFDNSTHKIMHTVTDWLSESSNVMFIDDSSNLRHEDIVKWNDDPVSDYTSLVEKFDPLIQTLNLAKETN